MADTVSHLNVAVAEPLGDIGDRDPAGQRGGSKELEALAEGNRVDVIIVARPDALADLHPASQAADTPDTARAPAGRTESGGPPPVIASFHDLLKARALRLGIPCRSLRHRPAG